MHLWQSRTRPVAFELEGSLKSIGDESCENRILIFLTLPTSAQYNLVRSATKSLQKSDFSSELPASDNLSKLSPANLNNNALLIDIFGNPSSENLKKSSPRVSRNHDKRSTKISAENPSQLSYLAGCVYLFFFQAAPPQ